MLIAAILFFVWLFSEVRSTLRTRIRRLGESIRLRRRWLLFRIRRCFRRLFHRMLTRKLIKKKLKSSRLSVRECQQERSDREDIRSGYHTARSSDSVLIRTATF